VAGAFKVVKCKNVLQLLVCVDDGPGTVFFADFDLIDDKLVDIIGLLIG